MLGGVKKTNMYWPALDGVRALAVLLVVLHHLGPLPSRPSFASELLGKVTSWGWIGVDCFFVLSGFLITRLLLEEKSVRGTISLPRFYLRRALRIWPLYYLALFVAFIVVPLTSSNHHPTINEWISYVPRASVPFILFAGNFGIIFDWKWLYEFNKLVSGYGTNMICVILMPLWSIAVEEQFYLLWPWVMKNCRSLKSLSCASLLIIAVGVLATILIISSLPTNSKESLYNHYYLNSACRLLPIMFGALIAIAHFSAPKKIESMGIYGMKLTMVFALLYAAMLYFLPPIEKVTTLHALTFATSAATFSTLLFLSLTWKPIKAFLSNPVLVYIGKRSYAIYLCHVTCLWFVRMFICPLLHVKVFTATEWTVTALIGIPLTILASELSWQLIEKHFLKLKGTLHSPSGRELHKDATIKNKSLENALP